MLKIEVRLWIILFAIASLLLTAQPAIATTWELAAEANQGRIRQYFDQDSIQRLGSDVTIISYYINENATPQRTDYVTVYNCSSNLFKDIEVNGQVTGDDWQPLIADPLNEAIRDRLCLKN